MTLLSNITEGYHIYLIVQVARIFEQKINLIINVVQQKKLLTSTNRLYEVFQNVIN